MQQSRVIVLAAAALVAGCGGDEAGPRGEAPSAEDAPLRQQLGSLLVSSFEGTTLPGYMRRRLRDGETVGAILFGPNVSDARGTRRLTAAIQRAAGGAALVMADQEPTVRQLPFADTADELAGAGVNVNLAPVADVAGPGSVMAGRAFAADVPERVAAAVHELDAAGVAATVKHFPGFGRATENTDDAPVTIDATRAELETDLEPFRAAIDADAPLVMSAHALYPALDPRHIASQSPAVLRGLLREELGFDGVVITDSLEAEAVLARSSVQVAAERSLAAGADLLLMTGRGSWIHVFPHLLRRARISPALRARIADSAARVERLRERLGLLD